MKKLLLVFFIPSILLSQKNEIAFKTYTLQPMGCKGFQTPWGGFIFIPDNAFQTEDGLDCRETITVKYREFHSQTDMFYSRLNMIYDNNGKYQILESVGMFEIQAWCGTKKLALRDGKIIQVRMKTRRDLPGLMSFIYNPSKRTWSKYQSPVFDFSYREKRNNADSIALWGSPKLSPATATIDPELGGVYNPGDYAAKLPEGFFKGMNIKEMGIFNYDGVIKDSLAVPMVPVVFVRNEKQPLQQMLYVTYPDRNTLVCYDPSDFKERFVLLNEKGIKMFTEYKDGSVAVTSDKEMAQLEPEKYRNKEIKIIVDKVPVKPKNEKELAAATGLNTN